MKRLLLTTAALTLLGTGAAGLAIAADAPTESEEPKVQTFDFDGDELHANYLKPNVDMLEGIRRVQRSSLISVRLDFVAEIVKSAEDI